MVETRAQQAKGEGKSGGRIAVRDPGQDKDTKDTTNQSGPVSLEPELGTALAIVVPFLAILLGLFAHKLGLIYIPGVDAWLTPFLQKIPKRPVMSQKVERAGLREPWAQ